MVLTGKEPLRTLPDGGYGKILKAQDYRVRQEGGEIVECARKEAQRILEQAGRDAEEARKRGYAEGFEHGKTDAAANCAETIISAERYLAKLDDQIVVTVMAAVRKIVGDLDVQDLTFRVVQSALSVVRRHNRVIVKVAPQWVETVQGSVKQLLEPYPYIKFIEVEADPNLSETSCIIETPVGRVEANLQTQLSSILGALAKSYRGGAEVLHQELHRVESELINDFSNSGDRKTA